MVKGIQKIQIGESTLWYLQGVKLLFTEYLRRTIEWGVQGVKGLEFGILNLSGLSLYHCTQYFSIVQKKTGLRPVDVGILPNYVNYLCTYVIGVYSLVFSFQACLPHEGLVKNWLPIKLPIFPTPETARYTLTCSNIVLVQRSSVTSSRIPRRRSSKNRGVTVKKLVSPKNQEHYDVQVNKSPHSKSKLNKIKQVEEKVCVSICLIGVVFESE